MASISHQPYPSGYQRPPPPSYILPSPDHQMPYWPPPRREATGVTPPKTPFEDHHFHHRRMDSRESSRPGQTKPLVELHRAPATQPLEAGWNSSFYGRPVSPQGHAPYQDLYPRRTPPPLHIQYESHALSQPPPDSYPRHYDPYDHPPHPPIQITSPILLDRRTSPPPAHHQEPLSPHIRSPPPPRYRGNRNPPPPARAGPQRGNGHQPERRGPVVASSRRHGSHPPRVQRDKRRHQKSRPRWMGSWDRGNGTARR